MRIGCDRCRVSVCRRPDARRHDSSVALRVSTDRPARLCAPRGSGHPSLPPLARPAESTPAAALDGGGGTRDNHRVTIDAPTPLPLRPSAADRERIARALRDGSVDGRLSLDTFSDRIERSFAASNREQLDELVADVSPPGPLRRAPAANGRLVVRSGRRPARRLGASARARARAAGRDRPPGRAWARAGVRLRPRRAERVAPPRRAAPRGRALAAARPRLPQRHARERRARARGDRGGPGRPRELRRAPATGSARAAARARSWASARATPPGARPAARRA